MCRLCCSRALWTARQGAPLVSASETRCSAVQSMAPGGSYFPEQTPPQQTRQGAHQHTTKKPNPERQKRKTRKGARHKGEEEKPPKDHGNGIAPKKVKINSAQGNRPEHQRAEETRDRRPNDKEEPKSRERTKTRSSRNKERGAAQRGAGQNTNTGKPTQRKETRRREAAADRRREGAQGSERILTCLSGCPKEDLEHQG